jgi:predicted RNase H-like nuclease
MAQIPAVDWSAAIDQLLAMDISHSEIGRAMSSVLTNKMISRYREGVQPAHWRGEALIRFWSDKTGHTREKLPMKSAPETRSRGVKKTRRQVDGVGAHLQAMATILVTPKKRGRKAKTLQVA